jgi:hypothetical protein
LPSNGRLKYYWAFLRRRQQPRAAWCHARRIPERKLHAVIRSNNGESHQDSRAGSSQPGVEHAFLRAPMCGDDVALINFDTGRHGRRKSLLVYMCKRQWRLDRPTLRMPACRARSRYVSHSTDAAGGEEDARTLPGCGRRSSEAWLAGCGGRRDDGCPVWW